MYPEAVNDQQRRPAAAGDNSTRSTDHDRPIADFIPFTRTFGLVIPGGVLGGIAMGVFLTELPLSGMNDSASGGLFLLGFSLGWALLTLLSPRVCERVQWWPLIPGGILAAIGAILLLGGFGLQLLTLIGVAWPLILVVIGVYLLLKRR